LQAATRGRCYRFTASAQIELLAQLDIEDLRGFRVFFQKFARVVAALSDAFATEAVPRSALLEHGMKHSQIDQVALARDPFAMDQIHFGFLEWRGDFVLHYFDLCAVADGFFTIFDGRTAPYVETDRRIEFQRAAARCGFGAAEHD